MKKIFLITGLFAAMSLLGQQVESGLLLHSSFDKFSTAPDYAASSQTVTSGIPQELQMRMYKDPANKLNAVMLNNKEFIGYTHQDNFNPQCGTISFWVKPVNWKMSDNQYFQTFFEVRSGDLAYRLIIYKINAANLLNVTLMNNGKQYTARIRTQWLPGEWHKVDFVWNSRSMKLYVDGVPPASGTRGEVIFKEDPAFPASIRWATLRLNYFQSWRVNPEWCTAYDDLKIYNRILSPAEILNAYEKVIPPKKAHVKLLVTSPGTVPVSVPLAGESAEGNCDSHVRISHSKDALFLDFTVGNAGAKYDIHTRDGELWQNDGVEFHLIGGDGKARQFIVNPAGALYDSMEGDPKWDSQAKVSAVRQGKNWTAHLEIPLNRLGGGQSFPVNFGVTDLSSGPRHFTWSPLSERSGFSDKRFFGTLVLGSSADRVDLISLGDLRAGQLNVDVQTAPGIRTETEYVTMSGIRGKKAQATLPEGKAEITFRAFDSAGKNIAVYSRTALVNPPINLITAAIPSENRIECRLDFSASGLKKSDVVLELKSEKDGKVHVSKTVFADTPEYTASLPIPADLPDNAHYKVIVKAGSFSAEQIFRVPDMTPFKTHVAVNHKVPAPWIPVSGSGRKWQVLDRIYEFENGPLPSQIVSRGKKLLVSPPRFLLNGSPIVWSEAKSGKNYGDYVELSAEGTFNGGTALIKGELWFDGMYKFDLQLKPSAPLKINTLRLQWSTPRELAVYALTPEYTPWKNDAIQLKWDPQEYNSLFWLTGHESGLAWWCKSDANWIINPNRNNITAKRKPDVVEVCIDLFAHSAILTKNAEYTMVFQATPPKRPDHSLREWAQGVSWFKDSDYVLVGGHSEVGRPAPDNIRNWTSLIPVNQTTFRNHMRKMHAQGFKTRLYGMPTHISKRDAEYDWFFRTCALTPGTPWQSKDPDTNEPYVVEPCCAHTPIGDLHAYRLDKLYREVPELDGIYFDIMHIKNCDNSYHGCGGVDAFGKKYTSSIALNLRSYILRIQKIHQTHKRLFCLHAHSAFFPFVHDLSDAWLPGEELFSTIEKNPQWGYLEVISPEAYQSAWNNEIRGVAINCIVQLERIPRVLKLPSPIADVMRSDEYALHSLAPGLLYDFTYSAFGSERQGHPLFKFWRLRKAVKLNEAKFHGYWVEPVASSAPVVKASWYSWNKKSPVSFMLCVVNTGRNAIQTGLKIDWKKLNTAPCELIDLWSKHSFTEKELADYTLNGHNFMLLVPRMEGEKIP